MNIIRNALLASTVLTLISSTCFANNTQIAVGSFFSTNKLFVNLPLLARSNDQGLNWNYPADILDKLPSNVKSGSLGKVACNANICVASGKANLKKGGEKPLLALSKDSGASWNYKLIANAAAPYFVDNSALTCTPLYCVVSLNYKNEKLNSEPLMVVIDDKANIFYSTVHANQPIKTEQLPALDCTANRCIAAGWSKNPDSLRISLSNDRAHSWSYIPVLLNGSYPKATLNAVKCNKNICIATGTYHSAQGDDVLVLRSENGGKTWTAIPTSYQPDKGMVTIVAITYSHHKWIMAGAAAPKNNIRMQQPLVLVSADEGMHWVQSNSAIINLPGHMSAQTAALSCVNQLCVMPVYSECEDEDASTFKFLVGVSTDEGINWRYSDLTPAHGTNGVLGSVACNHQGCFLAGSYIINNDYSHLIPFLSVSNDRGKTWFTPPTIFSNRPEQFESGEFSGGV